MNTMIIDKVESENIKKTEIKLGGGWKIIIDLENNEKYNTEYVTISKERSGRFKTKMNINPKYLKELGEKLIEFSTYFNVR